MYISTMKGVLVLLIAVVSLYGCGRYVVYGSLTSSCVYSQDDLPIPPLLAAGELQTIRTATQLIGHDPEKGCLESLQNQREITETKYSQYSARGRDSKLLEVEKQFKVIGVKAITKHGISTMDSGSGPIYYLMLDDAGGVKYYVATTILGVNASDHYLKLISGPNTYILDAQMFEGYSKFPSEFRFNPTPSGK